MKLRYKISSRNRIAKSVLRHSMFSIIIFIQYAEDFATNEDDMKMEKEE